MIIWNRLVDLWQNKYLYFDAIFDSLWKRLSIILGLCKLFLQNIWYLKFEDIPTCICICIHANKVCSWHSLRILTKLEGLHIRPPCLALLWRHNGCDSVSNHQPHQFFLLNRLFRRRSKKAWKAPRHWPLCGEFTGDRWPVNSPHKGPVTLEMFLFDDVIMANMGSRLSTGCILIVDGICT